MSAEVINHNPDLKRLQDEGYEIEIKQGHAIIYNVPYLDEFLQVQKGIIISPLNMSGEIVKYVNSGIAHVVYFKGKFPYKNTGEKLDAIVNSQQRSSMAGIEIDFMFSNKPVGGYRNYYHKLTNYINILSNEAKAICPTVTATTFKRVVSSENDVMVYADTNSSRAAITHLTDKFRSQKIAIVGLGGTGSYILDQIAKTPVEEIHLYDGDVFCQHNAFRAPGAPKVNLFQEQIYKTEYLASIYGNMHKHIFSHPYNLTEDNIQELSGMSYVFLAIDSGECKKNIIDKLLSENIAFVDTGIDIQEIDGSVLLGSARITECINGDKKIVDENISFAEAEKDLYQSNIQTADLNAFCALMAVIQWKKQCGFYLDNMGRKNCVYDTNDGEFK